MAAKRRYVNYEARLAVMDETRSAVKQAEILNKL